MWLVKGKEDNLIKTFLKERNIKDVNSNNYSKY